MNNEGFYLRHHVDLIEDLGDGWCRCRWADGRVWKHWRQQIKCVQWGEENV